MNFINIANNFFSNQYVRGVLLYLLGFASKIALDFYKENKANKKIPLLFSEELKHLLTIQSELVEMIENRHSEFGQEYKKFISDLQLFTKFFEENKTYILIFDTEIRGKLRTFNTMNNRLITKLENYNSFSLGIDRDLKCMVIENKESTQRLIEKLNNLIHK